MVILDEADHLLDLGFRKDVEKIVDCLHRQRQSLPFSATFLKEVRQISQLVLKREHVYVDTVGYGLETNPKVDIPSDREQYIHRLGRTGREGKEGEGILLHTPWEEYFLDNVKDLPPQKCSLPKLDSDVNVKIDSGVKEAAYHAWRGY